MNISTLIAHMDISFDELLQASKLPASTLSDIMSGKTELSHCQARTLQKLATGLGLSMEELLGLEAVTIGEVGKSQKVIRIFQPLA